MIFNSLIETANKYPDKLALNDWTYSQLLEEIEKQPYELVIYETDYVALLKILKAAKLNKPVLLLPKLNRGNIFLPKEVPDSFCVIMYSSGSSGKQRKPTVVTEKMMFNNSQNIIKCHRLTSEDRILNVSSLNHAGGHIQTFSSLLVGAHVILEPFNAFNYFKKCVEHNITVSHLIPAQVEALIKVDSNIETSLRFIMIGSDCVYRHTVEYFTNKGISVLHAYGMTEAGPPVFYHEWNKNDDMSIFNIGVMAGDNSFCDFKIENGELFLKGDIVSTDNWLPTGDCVTQHGNWIEYRGRKSHGCKIIPKQY